MTFYGLDCHKKSIQVEVINSPSENSLRSFSIPATPAAILQFASTLSHTDRVALESTTHAFPIASLLRKSGALVSVSNPLKTKIIAESKIKTDKVDALALANLLASDFLPTVWEPDEKTAQNRRIASFADAVTRQKTMVKNRIHAVLHRNLIPYGQFSDLFGMKGKEFLKTVSLPEDERFQIDTELSLLEFLEKTLLSMKQRIAKQAVNDEDTLRLMTILGIDFTVAIGLTAAIGDIHRFKNPKKLVGYLGLNPRIYQSGNVSYTGRITKQGRSHARWVLIQAAQHAVNAPSPLRAFFLRLAAKKGRNKAIVAVAAKLARIIWHMLTKKEDYSYAPPLRTKEKLAKLRIIATGERMKSGPKKNKPSKGGRRAYLTARAKDHKKGKEAELAYTAFVRKRLQSHSEKKQDKGEIYSSEEKTASYTPL